MSKEKTDEEIRQEQAAQQAVNAPPAPAFLRDVLKEQEELEMKPADDEEDRILAEGYDSKFWQILKRHIKARITTHNEMTNETMVKNPFNLAEIGYRSMLNMQINYALQDVINFVENRRKAVEVMQQEEDQKNEGSKTES